MKSGHKNQPDIVVIFLFFVKVLGHHAILKIRQLLGNWDNNVAKNDDSFHYQRLKISL